MWFRSDSFTPWRFLPARHALGEPDGHGRARFAANLNPHLAWGDAPAGTASFALWCVDSEAPTVGTHVNQDGVTVDLWLPRADFFHWVVWDLPPTLSAIAAGSHAHGLTPRGKPPGPTPDGGQTGLNDYTGWFAGDPELAGAWAGWDGPFPPFNDERVHAYHFELCALSVSRLDLPPSTDGRRLREAVRPTSSPGPR